MSVVGLVLKSGGKKPLQLTEDWGDELFATLKRAGGHAFSNMAVGFNNVDVTAATHHGIAVGNTPVSLLKTFIYASIISLCFHTLQRVSK